MRITLRDLLAQRSYEERKNEEEVFSGTLSMQEMALPSGFFLEQVSEIWLEDADWRLLYRVVFSSMRDSDVCKPTNARTYRGTSR